MSGLEFHDIHKSFRAVQALPGVATGNDFRSDFSVRGSDSRHMGLSIDGVAPSVTWRKVGAVRSEVSR